MTDLVRPHSDRGPEPMDEGLQFHSTVSNTTGANLTLQSSGVSSGKFTTSPPAQIANGDSGAFVAMGREGTWVGTEGNVVYQGFDGTTFKIKFDVPYSGANSGGISCDDGSTGKCSQYKVTSSPTSFPTSGDKVTQNYSIGHSGS